MSRAEYQAGSRIAFTRGDDVRWTSAPTIGQDATRAWWTAKRSLDRPDSEAVLQKFVTLDDDPLKGQVFWETNVLGDRVQKVRIVLSADEALLFTASSARYSYDLQTENADGDLETVQRGLLAVYEQTTRNPGVVPTPPTEPGDGFDPIDPPPLPPTPPNPHSTPETALELPAGGSAALNFSFTVDHAPPSDYVGLTAPVWFHWSVPADSPPGFIWYAQADSSASYEPIPTEIGLCLLPPGMPLATQNLLVIEPPTTTHLTAAGSLDGSVGVEGLNLYVVVYYSFTWTGAGSGGTTGPVQGTLSLIPVPIAAPDVSLLASSYAAALNDIQTIEAGVVSQPEMVALATHALTLLPRAVTWVKPFGKMDPKRELFAPGKRAWRRRRRPMFSGQGRARPFTKGK